MHYRSIFDLNAALVANCYRLPQDLDLIVGVPRSGLLAANLLSLAINVPIADLDGYLGGRILSAGKTKNQEKLKVSFSDIRRVLVLDDSILAGTAMLEARKAIAAAAFGHEYTFAAVYGQQPRHELCDHIFEVLPQPRVFQWNLMHHNVLMQACVDIDGVLCRDPTPEENDDGERYLKFVRETTLINRPTKTIDRLVTSRLEKYRKPTEEWLARHGIAYRELLMLDLPDAETRRKLGAHGTFKAAVYRSSDAQLFIESEVAQAREIARLSDRPVLCLENHVLYENAEAAERVGDQPARNVGAAPYRPSASDRVKHGIRAVIGDARYEIIKRAHRRTLPQ